jgi:hypothetical protein
MNYQLDPEFGDLMLDYEQHLIVVYRITQGLLRRQDLVQPQVARVIVITGKV